ncbi:hypothetical protein [Stenotrophomonas phage RAS14]
MQTYNLTALERSPPPKFLWDWSNRLHYSKYHTARVRRAKAKKKAKK